MTAPVQGHSGYTAPVPGHSGCTAPMQALNGYTAPAQGHSGYTAPVQALSGCPLPWHQKPTTVANRRKSFSPHMVVGPSIYSCWPLSLGALRRLFRHIVLRRRDLFLHHLLDNAVGCRRLFEDLGCRCRLFLSRGGGSTLGLLRSVKQNVLIHRWKVFLRNRLVVVALVDHLVAEDELHVAKSLLLKQQVAQVPPIAILTHHSAQAIAPGHAPTVNVDLSTAALPPSPQLQRRDLGNSSLGPRTRV